MTAKELKPGDEFKWQPRQKEFRTVTKIVPIPDSPTQPEEYRGGLIIILSNCKQIVLQPGEEIIIKGSEICTAIPK